MKLTENNHISLGVIEAVENPSSLITNNTTKNVTNTAMLENIVAAFLHNNNIELLRLLQWLVHCCDCFVQ